MRNTTPSRATAFVAALALFVLAFSIHAARETVAHFEKRGDRIVFDLSSKK